MSKRTLIVGALAGLLLLLVIALAVFDASPITRRAAPRPSRLTKVDLGRPPPQAGGGPSVPPGTALASHPLPSVFFGDVAVVGQVVDASSTPVLGADVHCRPSGFCPELDAEQRDRFRTQTGEGGVFEFRDLPGARSYNFMAFARHSYAELTVGAAQIRTAKIELVLNGIAYERYLFFDEAGQPVDVRGTAHPVFGQRIWRSRSPSLEERFRLETLGLAVPPLADNDVINVYNRAEYPLVRGPRGHGGRMYRIRVPGYAELQLPPERRPASDWPQGTRVVLHPDGETARGLVRYEVELPDLGHLGHEWRENAGALAPSPYISLVLRRMPEQFVHFVDPEHNVFFAPPRSRFEIGQHPMAPPLSYESVERDGRVVIRPSYPRFAMVVLRFELPAWGAAGGDVLVSPNLGQFPLYGQSAYPGQVLFGPLPAGAYVFMRSWRDEGSRPTPTGDSYGPVDVGPGVHVLAWR